METVHRCSQLESFFGIGIANLMHSLRPARVAAIFVQKYSLQNQLEIAA